MKGVSQRLMGTKTNFEHGLGIITSLFKSISELVYYFGYLQGCQKSRKKKIGNPVFRKYSFKLDTNPMISLTLESFSIYTVSKY